MGETINVLFHAQADGTYELRVRESWSGRTVSGPFIPPYAARQLSALQKKLGSFNSHDNELRELGMQLFAALCGADTTNPQEKKPADPMLQEMFYSVIQRTLKRRGTVALMLEFEPGCDDFMRYPWELLHNGEHFLLVSGLFTLSRVLLRPERPVGCELPVHPPFRLLYIAASPADCVPLETERSFEAMQQGLMPLIDNGQIFLDRLEPPTFSQLVRYLSSYGGAGMLDDGDTAIPCYVIHFDGHGAYGRLCPKNGCEIVNGPDARKCSACGTSLQRVRPQTYLCFCDDEGMNRFIDTQSIRDLLLSSDIRLAVFSACETAMLTSEPSGASQIGGRSAVDATLATALVTAQVPAVVAMPFSLQDDLSPTFMFHFYEALAEGRTLEEALARARQAMLPMQQKSWFVPVLYRHVAEEQEAPVPLLEIDGGAGYDSHPLAYLAPASTFVGRTQELRDLDELLMAAATGKQRSDVSGRLRIAGNHPTHHFALTGPVGIGKSSLACEAARRNRNKFPGGVIGVSLHQGKSFADAMIEMARRLRLCVPLCNTGAGMDSVFQTRLVQGTLRSLANRELPCLLLLDSFEEVKDQTEQELWLQFLSGLPQEVVVLVTSHLNPSNMIVSRGPHCRWYEYRLGKMAHDDLLTLFTILAEESGLDQRIHLDDPAQQTILHEICTLLDGYPLGAELIFGTARAIDGRVYTPEAATRSLEEVCDELRDTPLAGMLAALETSYRRLLPAARLLLAYLATFRLSFNREQILLLVTTMPDNAAPTAPGNASAGIASASLAQNWRAARDELVQTSFIQFDGHTYQIHAQFRNFALAYLHPAERCRVHRLIANYYATLPHPSAEEWFAAFEHLEAAGESEDLRTASRIAVRAAQALRGSTPLQDVLAMLRRAALHTSRLNDRSGEGQVLCCQGTILRQAGQYAEAEAYLRNALALQRLHGERGEAAWTLYELARLFNERGDFPQTWQYASEAQELFQEAGDGSGEAWIQVVLGEACHGQDRYSESLNYFARALEAFLVLGDKKGRAVVLHGRGLVSVMLGRYAQALHDYDEALQLFDEVGLLPGRAWVLASKGAAYIELLQYPENSAKKKDASVPQSGIAYTMNPNVPIDVAFVKLEQAEAACRAALTLFQELGVRRGQAWSLRLLGDTLRLHRDVARARECYEKAYALLNANANQIDLAHVLISLGSLLFDQGEYLEAKGLYEQASAITRDRGARRLYGLALRGLGDVVRVLRQYGDAEYYYRDALTIAIELGESSEQSTLLLRQGMLCEEQKQYREALDFWVQALTLDPQLRYPPYSNLQQRVNVLVTEHHLEETYNELRDRHSLVSQ